ncbi:hypothetical protein [Bacillus thermotolerans]|uniref:hypothetical protein n=1 Tax=Bacillus thermotolerans TaxID=1221996 RepID=UPI00057CE02C|nr:hypothetical protein [Bacillus thermotolerans]KKB33095.1 hypothetical protein QY97_03992 [Bacillus thermotolerans]
MRKPQVIFTSVLLALSMFSLADKTEATEKIEDFKELQVKIENNKLIEGEKLKAEKVDKKKATLDAMLEEQNLNEETLREEGDFYYDSSKDQFVLQIKKDIKDTSKKEKFNNLKNHSKARTITNAVTNDIIIEEVKYSNEELIEVQDHFFKVHNPELFTQNTNLNLDTINNRLELVTDSISDDLKRSLEDTYGDKLHVKVDPSFVDKHEPLKARKDNWKSTWCWYWGTKQYWNHSMYISRGCL